MSKVNIMGIDIDSLTNQETINKVEEYIINKKPLHLMGVNADKLNLCKTDKKLEDLALNLFPLLFLVEVYLDT